MPITLSFDPTGAHSQAARQRQRQYKAPGDSVIMAVVVLAPLTRQLASTIPTARAPHRRNAMAQTVLAAAASSWAVLMGIAPLLQIRRMLRQRSSREVSLGYFTILLIGFLLWICYGLAAGIEALVIPNTVALLVGAAVIIVALRLRRQAARDLSQPADTRAQR
jgi:MtN3 and saliva related transmembrane protein